MKINDNFPKKIPQGFKTRYDDIMQDILREKSEKYAKSTNTACWILGLIHQPKMPASLIKKD